VLAYEAGEADQFGELFQKALTLFDEARKLDRENIGVSAVCGGSLLTFADRLPAEVRADAWSDAWEDYQVIWKQQGPGFGRMPQHITGELLAGLAQSAQRTGRSEESAQYLDKIIEAIPKSAYAREARKWKDDPQYAAVGNLGCKSCHAPGRLSARLREIEGN
jgi:tetratricopeptide (TPR) repeat protein